MDLNDKSGPTTWDTVFVVGTLGIVLLVIIVTLLW